MKINSGVVYRVDDKGLDALMSVLGYPEKDRMSGEDWRDFYNEANAYIFEESMLELEQVLRGERVRKVQLPNRPEGGEEYDEI